jgi:hypothetical protein
MQRWCQVVILSVVTLSGAGKAAGPATTDAGAVVRWVRSEIELQPVAPLASAGISAAELVRALDEAARGWNKALAECNTPQITIGKALKAGARAIQDDRSIVVVRDKYWCPERALEREDCYDNRSAGLTHLYPRRVPGSAYDGELREADIEINDVHFQWGDDQSPQGEQKLLALMVHELGHVLGLAPEEIGASNYRESIMYPDPLERGRPLVLKPDTEEVQQLCDLYSQRAPLRLSVSRLG